MHYSRKTKNHFGYCSSRHEKRDVRMRKSSEHFFGRLKYYALRNAQKVMKKQDKSNLYMIKQNEHFVILKKVKLIHSQDNSSLSTMKDIWEFETVAIRLNDGCS